MIAGCGDQIHRRVAATGAVQGLDPVIGDNPEVQVWLWQLPPVADCSSDWAAPMLTALLPAEQERLRSMGSPRRQRDYLAGHSLLRVALAVLMPVCDAPVPLALDDDQQLRIHGPLADTIDFNLSHSGDWVACVVGRGCRVGIDIELPGRLRPYRTLAAEYFTGAEQEQLATLNDADCRAAFYRLWTLKESYLKACRQGLSMAGLATGFVPWDGGTAGWYSYPLLLPFAPQLSAALTVSAPLATPLPIRMYDPQRALGADAATPSWQLCLSAPLTPAP